MSQINELEIYACIDGYPDYLVTSHGRVLSLKGKKIKEMKQTNDKVGYKHLMLCKNNKTKTFLVHRLVAQAFIPNTENKPQVNHVDENKSNNNVYNLEWVTAKENLNYGMRNERRSKTLKSKGGYNKKENHPMYGKHHSEESKHKMSIARRGKRHSEETKRKISESHRGKNKKKVSVIYNG